LQVEAAALLWAFELAAKEKYERIVVEGDAKCCFEALNGEPSNVNWNINSIICNILSFRSLFLSCNFVWVRREANGVAHTMAEYAPSTSFPLFCYSSTFLPRPVLKACKLDSLYFPC
jgi:ribonuclease HI